MHLEHLHLKRIGAAAWGGAIVLAGALAASSPAQAAVYSGIWDPAYGGIFPSLGWKASAMFDVPTACLSQGDGSYGATGACSGFTVLSADLSFYDVSDPTAVLESFSLNTNVFVNGIDIAGGQLVGINTGYFGAVVPSGASLPVAGNGNYGFSLILFGGTSAQLVYTNPTTASPLCFPGNAIECGYSANAAVGTITPAVPEPETYALMLGGIGVLGWVARRRAQRLTQT